MRGPTRGDNLLDLLLSDIDNCKAMIADHRPILAFVKLPMPREIVIQRDVWHFKQARWQNIRCQLRNQNWSRLKNGSVDDAFNYFVDLLNALRQKYIPRETIAYRKKSHPWLTDDCRMAIDSKNAAIDSPSFVQKQQDCAQKLKAAHKEYIVELQNEIAALSESDKQWWTLNRNF